MDPEMAESLDRWITGNYGDDAFLDDNEEDEEVEEYFDPRYDEPLDFGEDE